MSWIIETVIQIFTLSFFHGVLLTYSLGLRIWPVVPGCFDLILRATSTVKLVDLCVSNLQFNEQIKWHGHVD